MIENLVLLNVIIFKIKLVFNNKKFLPKIFIEIYKFLSRQKLFLHLHFQIYF
jgi:hypothetical protein